MASKFSGNAAKDLSENGVKLLSAFRDAIEDEYISTVSKVIDETPEGIPNSERSRSAQRKGNVKFNWQIGRSVNNRVLRGAGKNGKDYAEKGIRGKLQDNKDLFLFSNHPAIRVIENGGYPTSVKRGTYRRGTGYEKRSSGGFSRLAPTGMVRKNFSGFTRRLGRRIDAAWSRIK